MANFGERSLNKLSTCHLELQNLFKLVIKQIDCAILEGYRNQVDQEKAFEKGNSQLHFPFGKHNANPSMAVDAIPYPIDWKDLRRIYFFAGFILGTAEQLKNEGKMTHSVRWGGDWNRNYDILDEKGFADLVHFELII